MGTRDYKTYYAATSEARRAYDVERKARDQDKIAARFRTYYVVHADELLARRRVKYAADQGHRDRILASNRASKARARGTT